MVRVHVFIYGRVQGVWFRKSTKIQALRFGITGWVQNKSSCVEAIFEGSKEKVDKIVSWCKRGPLLAKVEKVEVKQETVENLTGFKIIR
tara:strand:- start:971 stop:1237 length:267 start_codon:yes stop_codon:yes gene_type:complete